MVVGDAAATPRNNDRDQTNEARCQNHIRDSEPARGRLSEEQTSNNREDGGDRKERYSNPSKSAKRHGRRSGVLQAVGHVPMLNAAIYRIALTLLAGEAGGEAVRW